MKTKPVEKITWKETKVTRRIKEIQILKTQKQVTKREATIAQAVLQKHVAELSETFSELKNENQAAILATTAQLIPQTETINEAADKTDKSTATGITETAPPETTLKIDAALTGETTTLGIEENLLDAIVGDDTEKLKVALTQEVNKQIQKIRDSAEMAAKDGVDTTEKKTDTSLDPTKTDTDIKKDSSSGLPGAALPAIDPTAQILVPKTTPTKPAPTTTIKSSSILKK